MGNDMITLGPQAQDVMKPLGPVVPSTGGAPRALELMKAGGHDFLPVVGPDSGVFLGVVLRKGIERGCLHAGHAEDCMVVHHLKRDVPTLAKTESVDGDWLEGLAGGPVVVLDPEGRPVGQIVHGQ